jgi:arylsulfatase A-like enzyme
MRFSNRLVNSGVDLIPTLCDYAGIATPTALPGLSLRDATNGPRKYVVISNKMVQGAPIAGRLHTPSGRIVRSKCYKYCVYDEGQQRESLFDLEMDPGNG